MGRVKLQIKKIENTTNRQVTYSKRRNGLMKKAYELSVLCEVDVALVMFSPSGRPSLFSGNNKSIEDIITRYVNLPEHERGRLQNQDHLNRAISKLREETNQNREPSPVSADSQLEDLQEELKTSKCQLEEMENRLRIFESDPSEITTLEEVHYRQHLLEETLKQIHLRKQVLEGNYECHNISQPTTQVQMTGAEHMQLSGLVTRDANNLYEWFPQRDHQQVHALNFLDSNGLLPQSEQTHGHQGVDGMLLPSLNLLSGGNMTMEEHMSRRSHRSSGTEEDNHNNNENNTNANGNHRVRAQGHQASTGYGQAVNANPQWANQFYHTGNNHTLPSEQPRERALLELFLSQFTP